MAFLCRTIQSKAVVANVGALILYGTGASILGEHRRQEAKNQRMQEEYENAQRKMDRCKTPRECESARNALEDTMARLDWELGR